MSRDDDLAADAYAHVSLGDLLLARAAAHGGDALLEEAAAALDRLDATPTEEGIVSEHEAGQEMDALIAERVMGWGVNRADGRHWHTVGTQPRRLIGRDCCAEKYAGGAWCPSTDIAAASQVVERVREQGYEAQMWSSKAGWRARFQNDESLHTASATTAPLAICRAALLVLATPTEEGS
jgi:hypothetical protein